MTHLLHVFATFGGGGPQIRAAQLIARMPEGFRHSVVAMDGETSCRDRVPDAFRLDVRPPPAARGFLRVARCMAATLRKLSPDLVLTYNWGAIETVVGARLGGHRGVVHHEDGFGPEEAERRLWRRNRARRWLLRGARAVIVPSATLLRIAEQEWGLSPDLIRHLPNGVDLQRFRPAAERREGPLVIGHVGSLREEKNQALLLRAAARMRHRDRMRIVLVGDGPQRPGLTALTTELGLQERVAFRGARDDPAGEYRKMDVFALSSRTEQMPLSVLEAMASGLPVVSTKVGDVPDMLAAEGRQLLVEPDEDEYARVLDRLVEEPELRSSVGEANRRRCEAEYELEACLSRYLRVYQQALAEL